MSRRARLGLLALAAACSSCSDLTDTRRWSSARDVEGTGEEVTARVFVASATPAAGAPIGGLGDASGAAYVAAMAKFSRDAAQFRDAVAEPLGGAASAHGGQLPTDGVQRLLVAVLSRSGPYRPGDRILQATINVRPLNFTFGDYTVAQTERKTLDVTSLTRGTTQTANATLSGSAPGVPISGGASAGYSHTVGTTTPLRDAQEVLTVSPTPGCLTIVREGGYGTDLTGNTLIAMTTRAKAPFRQEPCGLTDQDVRMQPSGSGRQPLFVVDPDTVFGGSGPKAKAGRSVGKLSVYPRHPFAAQVIVDFVLRRIRREAASYEDGSQTVDLVSGHKVRCEILLQPEELTPPLFVISVGDKEASEIVALDVDGEERTLAFSDPEAARAAARWMEAARPSRFGGMPFKRHRPGPFTSRALPGDASDPCGTASANTRTFDHPDLAPPIR